MTSATRLRSQPNCGPSPRHCYCVDKRFWENIVSKYTAWTICSPRYYKFTRLVVAIIVIVPEACHTHWKKGTLVIIQIRRKNLKKSIDDECTFSPVENGESFCVLDWGTLIADQRAFRTTVDSINNIRSFFLLYSQIVQWYFRERFV